MAVKPSAALASMMAWAEAPADSVCSISGTFLMVALQRAATTTISGARNAFCRSRSSDSAVTSGCVRLQVRREQAAEARARRAAHDDEAPRPQSPVIRGACGAGEDQLERTLVGRRFDERARRAARQ